MASRPGPGITWRSLEGVDPPRATTFGSVGDCAGAIVAYERALRVTWHHVDAVRFMFLPLLLHSLALCHEKLGDLPAARERNAEMLRLWANADPDIPLLAEAKADAGQAAPRFRVVLPVAVTSSRPPPPVLRTDSQTPNAERRAP